MEINPHALPMQHFIITSNTHPPEHIFFVYGKELTKPATSSYVSQAFLGE